MRTYYDILGISSSASPEEIKRAYRQLALQYHPDKNPSAEAAERMRQINEAYQTLSDPAARERYDQTLARALYRRPASAGSGYSDRPAGAYYGYEAPRHTVVYEHTTFFSMGNLFAAAVLGITLGLLIAGAFNVLGVRLETRPGMVTAILLAAFALFAPPLLAIIQLRKNIGSDSEARMVGSVVLSATLSVAVAAAALIATVIGDASSGPNPFCACCGLAPACAILGWVIGGWVGKIARNMFPT